MSGMFCDNCGYERPACFCADPFFHKHAVEAYDLRREISDLEMLCRNLVQEFFKDEPHKAALWFNTPNPMLGDIRPLDMIKLGRVNKLYQFIKDASEGNL